MSSIHSPCATDELDGPRSFEHGAVAACAEGLAPEARVETLGQGSDAKRQGRLGASVHEASVADSNHDQIAHLCLNRDAALASPLPDDARELLVQ